MPAMSLSSENKLTARTSAEVDQGVRQVVLRQQARGLKFGPKKIGIEGVVGCLLLEILARTDEEIDGIIDRWLPTLGDQIGGQYATKTGSSEGSDTRQIRVIARRDHGDTGVSPKKPNRDDKRSKR